MVYGSPTSETSAEHATSTGPPMWGGGHIEGDDHILHVLSDHLLGMDFTMVLPCLPGKLTVCYGNIGHL